MHVGDVTALWWAGEVNYCTCTLHLIDTWGRRQVVFCRSSGDATVGFRGKWPGGGIGVSDGGLGNIVSPAIAACL